MSKAVQPSVSLFVRNAWLLLGFQLLAATAALAVTAWAALQVRPLLAERERLEQSISEAQARIQQLSTEEKALRAELQGARDATPLLNQAITAYHRKKYGIAVDMYAKALKVNPGDPYIYNLMSYSQFKAGDLSGAIQTLSRGLEIDPSYDWGYFDLARYQCAAGSPKTALNTITHALEIRGEPIRRGINYFLSEDEEFPKKCAQIVSDLRKLEK